MPDTTMVPMLAPDGTSGMVPQDQVPAAVKAGGKLGVKLLAPDGTPGTVPMDRAHDAIKAGARFVVSPVSVGAPNAINPVNPSPAVSNNQDSDTDEDSGAGAVSAVLGSEQNPLKAGFDKGLAETGHTVGRVINAATGDRVPGLPTSFKEPDYLQASGAAETVGKIGEGIAEFMTGDEALKGMALSEKLGLGTKLAKLAEAHPAIARIIDAGLNAVRGGSASGVQSGLHDPSTTSVATGAAFGAGGELAGEAAGIGASKLFPRTTEAASADAAETLRQATSQRQGAAKSVTDLAGKAVDTATGKGASTASDFKSAADQIRQNYSPTFDKLREATGGTRNNLGRYGANGFDDVNSQIKRAKQVLYSPSPSSTDALKQAEKELTEGEAKLRAIFDSTPNVSKTDLAQAKQAWANASTLEDLHGYVDQAFSEPSGIRNIPGSKPSEIDPTKFVQRANRAVDEIGADKLKAALGATTFSNFLEVRQGLSKFVGEANYDKALDKAARTYLREQGASLNKAVGGPVAGASTAYFSHLLGASNPLTAGIGATVGLIHFMYTNPAAGVKILRLAQKSAPYAAQVGKQVVTHVFNPESGDVEEQ
jgi:hypothetical protein